MHEFVIRTIAANHNIVYRRIGSAVYLDGVRYRDASEAFALLTLAVTGPRLVGGVA